MDTKSKKSILRQLAKKDQGVAMEALQREARKIAHILNGSTNYQELFEALELLDIIAYRVHAIAVIAIKDFLLRENSLELSYNQDELFPQGYLEQYQNFPKLFIRSLTILEHIRYHDPDKILSILFEFADHNNKEISDQAKKSIIEYAKFHLEIFYANGKDWAGLGPQPQEKLIDMLNSFDEKRKLRFFSIIKDVCKEMLSPTMEGTSWTYQTVTLSTGYIPATRDIKDLRLKTLEILSTLYPLATNAREKISVLGAMCHSCRVPSQGKYSDELLKIIIDDTVWVLRYIKGIVDNAELEVAQRIEHDVFWLFRRNRDPEIQSLALEIKGIVDRNTEYQIFKILIGFQGVFSEWSNNEEGIDGRDFERERELRRSKARDFALSVTKENFLEWKGRILSYSQIESNDLATFPYFSKFLEDFARESPLLAIEFIQKDHQRVERFLVAIFSGLLESHEKDRAQQVASSWIKDGLYLYSFARLVSFAKEFDKDFLVNIFVAARQNQDLAALVQIASSILSHYKGDDKIDIDDKKDIQDLFILAIQELTKHNNSDWIYDFWYRKEKSLFFEDIKSKGCSVILENFLLAKTISYQHEEVLVEIAKYSPEDVIEFFCRRIDIGAGDTFEEGYEAVPFSFNVQLADALSKIPHKAVDIVFEHYNDDYVFFMFRGGKLLGNIFLNFPDEFSEKLISLINQDTQRTTLFVLGILRNYDGNSCIKKVCKELVKILPNEGSLINETEIVLQSTGVVSGEYGFAEAYQSKIEDIKIWLDDDNPRVREFAKEYIIHLERQIENENQRVSEEISIRKHQFGDHFDEE